MNTYKMKVDVNKNRLVVEIKGQKCHFMYPEYVNLERTPSEHIKPIVMFLATPVLLSEDCTVKIPFEYTDKQLLFFKKYVSNCAKEIIIEGKNKYEMTEFDVDSCGSMEFGETNVDNPIKHLTSLSFGKDTSCTLGLLEEVDGRKNVHAGTVNMVRRDWQQYKVSKEKLEKQGYNIHRLWSDINVFTKRFMPHCEKTTTVHPSVFLPSSKISLMLKPIAYNIGAEYIWIGSVNSYTYNYSKEDKFVKMLDLSHHLLHGFNKVFPENTCSSVIAPLSEYGVQKILFERYPKIGKGITSCQNANNFGRWCMRCLPAESLILMKDESQRLICDIKKGDEVYKGGKVVEIFNRKVNTIYEIETESGEKLKMSDEHPVYTKNGWKEAKDLTTEDEVYVYEKNL